MLFTNNCLILSSSLENISNKDEILCERKITYFVFKSNYLFLKINYLVLKFNYLVLKFNYLVLKFNYLVLKFNYLVLKINYLVLHLSGDQSEKPNILIFCFQSPKREIHHKS